MPDVTMLGPNAQVRLAGELAAGTLTSSIEKSVRIYVGEADNVEVLARVSGISTGAVHPLRLFPIVNNPRLSGDGGTRVSAPVSATLANNVDNLISVANNGYRFYDVVIAMGASSNLTLGSVDVMTGQG